MKTVSLSQGRNARAVGFTWGYTLWWSLCDEASISLEAELNWSGSPY